MPKSTKIYLRGKDIAELAEINNNAMIGKATFPPDTVRWRDGSTYKTYEQFNTGQFKLYGSGYAYSEEVSYNGKTLGQAFGGLTASAKGYRPLNRLISSIDTPGTYMLRMDSQGNIMLDNTILLQASLGVKSLFILCCGAGGGAGGNYGGLFGGFGGAGGGGGAMFLASIRFDMYQECQLKVGKGGVGGNGNTEQYLGTSGENSYVHIGSNSLLAGGGTRGMAQNTKKESPGGTYMGNLRADKVFAIVAKCNGGNGAGINKEGYKCAGFNATYCPEGTTLFAIEGGTGGLVDKSNGVTNAGGGGGGGYGSGGNGGGGTSNSPGKHGYRGGGGGGAGNYISQTFGGNGGDGFIQIFY